MLFPSVLLIVIYAAVLFVPGYLVVTAFRIERYRFFLAYMLSLYVLFLTIAVAFLARIQMEFVVFLYAGFIIVLMMIVSVKWLWIKRFSTNSCAFKALSIPKLPGLHVAVPMTIVLIIAVHHGLVGPYTEIPSDFWKHLARTVDVYNFLEEKQYDISSKVFQAGGIWYWYLTHAIVSRVLHIHPLESVTAITLVTSTSFILATYWFTLQICEPLKLSRIGKIAVAGITSLLIVTTFGTATF